MGNLFINDDLVVYVYIVNGILLYEKKYSKGLSKFINLAKERLRKDSLPQTNYGIIIDTNKIKKHEIIFCGDSKRA